MAIHPPSSGWGIVAFSRRWGYPMKRVVSRQKGLIKLENPLSILYIATIREIARLRQCILRSHESQEVKGHFLMLPGYQRIVEERIREAQKNGEFDNLPGRGKPLSLEEESHIPEDLRIAYKILKNADCLPPEILEKKEIYQMEELLASIPDEKERYKLVKKINYRIMKLNMMGKRSPLLEENQIYCKKVIDKMAEKERRSPVLPHGASSKEKAT